MNLGALLANQKKFSEAISHLKEVLEHNPKNAEARFNLGSIYVMERDLAKGKEQFERLLLEHPGHRGAAAELERVRQESQP